MLTRQYVKLLFFVLFLVACLQASRVWAVMGTCIDSESAQFIRSGIGCAVSPFYYTMSASTECTEGDACPQNIDCCADDYVGERTFLVTSNGFTLCSVCCNPDYIGGWLSSYGSTYGMSVVVPPFGIPILPSSFNFSKVISYPVSVTGSVYDIIDDSLSDFVEYKDEYDILILKSIGEVSSVQAHFDRHTHGDSETSPVLINGVKDDGGYEPSMWVNCSCSTPGIFCCSQTISITCADASFYKATLTTSGEKLAIVRSNGAETESFDGWSCCDDVSDLIYICPIRYDGKNKNAKMDISLSVTYYDKGGNNIGNRDAKVTVKVAELIDLDKLANGGE